MYEPPKKEEVKDDTELTPEMLEERLLQEDIDRVISMYPDFSTTGVKIDDIIPHAELDKYNPVVVLRVAAKNNFDLYVCTCGETHQQPKLRANGKWVDPPKNLEWENIAEQTMCEACGDATRTRLMKTYDKGNKIQPTYKSMRQILGYS